MDAKTKYKAKKIKAVFFDIDDTLRIKDTGFMPESIKTVFAAPKEKRHRDWFGFRTCTLWCCSRGFRP